MTPETLYQRLGITDQQLAEFCQKAQIPKSLIDLNKCGLSVRGLSLGILGLGYCPLYCFL